MALKVSVGLFKKRVMDTLGSFTEEKIPFLPKTLAKLVYMSNGESIEHAMQAQNVTVTNLKNDVDKISVGDMNLKSYPTMEAYKAALEDGSASASAMYIIED